MEIFDKIRQVLRLQVDCLLPWIAMGGRDDPVQRGKTSNYDGCIWRWCCHYVKGREKRTWLRNLLLDDERERMYIETLDAIYEDMESLSNLDVINTMRCGQHIKDCVLQNILKM